MGIRPRDIIQHMQVPETPFLYVLGGFDARVTIYSQQVRALNLIYSLRETDRLKERTSVAIVGAGIAGLTAAAGAACCGADVTVFEQSTQYLALIGNSTKRWLHPHIYEWPIEDPALPHPLDTDAGLPIMNWQSGSVTAVRAQLLTEYNRIEKLCNIAPPRFQVTKLKIGSGDENKIGLMERAQRSDTP